MAGSMRISSPCRPVRGRRGQCGGNKRRRARVSHVYSRSRACSRQVSARAHVEEAAMGTLRNVGIRVPNRCTRSRPAGRGAASGERVCAGGAVLPRASAARTAVGQLGPGHRAPFGLISRQARHTRSPWVSRHASGGVAPVDRCTERRWDTKDCRQLHPVGEAPSRHAHRGMGQNHIPEGAGAAVGGCWVGLGPSIARLTRDRPSHWDPCREWGVSCIFLRLHSYRFPVRFHRCPWGVPWGHPCVPLHDPARCLRVGCHRYSQGVPSGGNLRGRSRLRWGVRAGFSRITLVEE